MARQRNPADAVQFTYESAQRIANVVRAAETSPPSASPLTFQSVQSSPRQFKIVSFTGVWSKGQVKSFTVGVTPATSQFSANNLFQTVGTANTQVSTFAALARVPSVQANGAPGTLVNWVLVAAECRQ